MSAYPPPKSGNKFTISVLSTHSSDSTPALLVTFPDQRYLFNVPEAISRIALQSKVGLRKVGNVFLGSLDESAGLPGFILSSVEAGNRKIEIVGPLGTEHYLASCRFFTRREKLSLKISSPSSIDPSRSIVSDSATLPPPIHADANLNVYALPLSLSPSSPSLQSLKRKRSQSRSPSPRPKSPPGESRSSDGPKSSPRQFDSGSPSFRPSKLSGAEAHTWRRMVLRDMFRGTAFEGSEAAPTAEAQDAPRQERRGPTPAYLPQSLPPFSGATDAISYLVVGPLQQGKFLPTEATKRGVKPGRLFAKLKNGERVWVRTETTDPPPGGDRRDGTGNVAVGEQEGKQESKKERLKRLKEEKARLEEAESLLIDGEGEGRWVTPDECMEPSQDASAFLILNIPSPEYLPSLARDIPPRLLGQPSIVSSTSLVSVFYLLGQGVVGDPRFQTYLASMRAELPETVRHQMSSADDVARGKDEITFGPSALLNLRLSALDGSVFHVPKYSFVPDFRNTSAPNVSTVSANSHFAPSASLLSSIASPLGGEVRSFNFQLGSEEAETEAGRLKGEEKPRELQVRGQVAWQEYLRKAGEVRTLIAREEEERSVVVEVDASLESIRTAEDGLRVTPLGTGSAIPSKYRNVSSTLVHFPASRGSTAGGEEFVFLDAGEGTWGQLARRFGRAQAEVVLSKTKMIFISHLHQDHHAGLSTLLKVRARLTSRPPNPLTIVAPSNARTYLFEQHQLLDLGLSSNDVRFIDNFNLEPGKTLHEESRLKESYDQLLAALDLKAVVAVPVLHRCRAWGVVITHRSGLRIVFSGDTMPCEALVEHGRGASLLIHEATIEDELPEVALAKGHSTFAQAIDIGVRMEARHLLLTHFSARYPKLPPASASSQASTAAKQPLIATAFDLMTLRLSEFWKMDRYRDALDALLSWDEIDERNETSLRVGGSEKDVN